MNGYKVGFDISSSAANLIILDCLLGFLYQIKEAKYHQPVAELIML